MKSQWECSQNKFIKFEMKKGARRNEKQAIIEAEFFN